MAVSILLRRGTAAEWAASNPILLEGEVGVETDTKKLKVGDGLTAWTSLPYITLTPTAAASLYATIANPSFTGTVTLDTGVTLVFEGATANNFETTLTVVDPTADRTLSLPNSTGTLATQEHVTSEIGTHSSATTSVHGIADTSNLVTTGGTQTLTNKTITTPAGLVKSDVGLGSVDNTTDANKPVSTATQTALDFKAPLASPTFTGTVSGVTKSHVGLGNVDNTADAAKPVSTAQQTALDLKANLSGATFTGAIAGTSLTLSGDLTVNGTTTTLNSTTMSVDDKNIELGSVASPSDVTADGGGITLKGATDKTFNWVDATDSWTSSEHIDLASGKGLKVNGTAVISSTAG